MPEHNSPYFQAGIADGQADAGRSPRVRRGFDPARAHSWMYRRGFARAFLAARAADAIDPAPRDHQETAMPQTAILDAGQQAVWTGRRGLFSHPVTIRRAYNGGLVILGEEQGPWLYDFYDHETGLTVLGIPVREVSQEGAS
jgi:hypothetical protein